MWNTFLVQTPSKDKLEAQLRIIDCLANVNEECENPSTQLWLRLPRKLYP